MGYIRASLDFRAHFWAYDTSLPPSPGFIRLLFYLGAHVGVSMEAFRDVTPSFDFSEY
jgi:hypothetical protein